MNNNKRNKHKDDMMEELFGAAFVGGYGGALIEADEIDEDDEEDTDDDNEDEFSDDSDES